MWRIVLLLSQLLLSVTSFTQRATGSRELLQTSVVRSHHTFHYQSHLKTHVLMSADLFFYNIDPSVLDSVGPDPNNTPMAFFESLQTTFFRSVSLRVLGAILG